MRSAPTHRRGRRVPPGEPGVGDGGAVLVEFALAVPLLVVLFLGVLQFGSAFDDANVLKRAVAAAGRTAATVADERPADRAALEALASTLNGAARVEIERVVIYRVAGTNGEVPPQCLAVSTAGLVAHGIPGLCNVYSGEQAASTPAAAFGGTLACASGSWDVNWCPTGRERDGTPDRVGVWAEVRYEPFTGLLPASGIQLREDAIYQLEPTAAGG
jgi:hypothetical protein